MGFKHFYGKFSPQGNVHIKKLEFGYPLTLLIFHLCNLLDVAHCNIFLFFAYCLAKIVWGKTLHF